MIDLHCHIIPHVDDGARSLHESFEMGKIAYKDGIRKIAATPHVCPPHQSLKNIVNSVSLLNSQFYKEGIDVDLIAGSENCSSMEIEALSLHCIGSTNYCLIEFPHNHLPKYAVKYLFDMMMRGIHPIFAHPERNGSVLMRPDILEDIVKQGVVLQVTAGSLAGDFGPQVRECAKYIVKKRWTHIIATDAHSSEYRPPIISKGLDVAIKLIGKKDAVRMVTETPELIINGEQL